MRIDEYERHTPAFITDHAAKRAEQRMNLGRRSAERMRQIVLERGTPSEKLGGRLGQFVQQKGRETSKAYVYGNFIYIFGDGAWGKDDLITVFPVPKRLRLRKKRQREFDHPFEEVAEASALEE